MASPFRIAALAAALGTLSPCLVAGADSAGALCRLVLHEEVVDRDDLALDRDVAETTLAATEEVYGLLERLWQEEAVARLLYQRALHDRDVARLERDRLELLLEREAARIDQFTVLCAAVFANSVAEENRDSLDEAYHRYRVADCRARALESEIARVDLAYDREVLASYRDLRENDVATRQDIIFSESAVEISRRRMEQTARRARECGEELGLDSPPADGP
jgi:hypothetical protein